MAPGSASTTASRPTSWATSSLSRGFKSGGYNVRAQSNIFPESAEPFDDETLDMGEMGVKSTLADGRLVLNTAIFYGQYKDIQVSTFTSYDGNGDGIEESFFGNFINAGNATLQGVEVEFNFNSDSWFGMNGYVSYLDATPDELPRREPRRLRRHPGHHQRPGVDRALRANVDFPLFGGLLTGSLGYSYRDDSTLTNEGGQYPGRPGQPLLPLMQPSFGVWDTWVSWLAPNGNVADRPGRQEPGRRGVPDQRLQPAVARRRAGLVRRAALLLRHRRVPVLTP